MINSLKNISTRFARDEDGIALTEYLLLLGLLTGAVITAVLLFGVNLGAQWDLWANWIDDDALAPDGDITVPTTTVGTTTTTGGGSSTSTSGG